jgi:hypothetical protein
MYGLAQENGNLRTPVYSTRRHRPICTLGVELTLALVATLPTLELEVAWGSKARIMQARVGFGGTRNDQSRYGTQTVGMEPKQWGWN